MPVIDLSDLPPHPAMTWLNLPVPRIQDLILQCIPGSIIYDEQPPFIAELTFYLHRAEFDTDMMVQIHDAASALPSATVIGWYVSQQLPDDDDMFEINVYDHTRNQNNTVPPLNLSIVQPHHWHPFYQPSLNSIPEGNEEDTFNYLEALETIYQAVQETATVIHEDVEPSWLGVKPTIYGREILLNPDTVTTVDTAPEVD